MSELKDLMVAAPKLTLAVAESLTCGHLQARIGAESGASGFFTGGVTAYTIDQKVALLNVEREAAAAVDCVSDEIARQMARGVCKLFGSDVGAATTGYAEGNPDKGVTAPFACWALARRDGAGGWVYRSGRITCPGVERTRVQMTVAQIVHAELPSFVREGRG
ncbi:MAG TPA: nicotinamide-nucleotide amidohydrolase family protein [Opitutaceae bacterium]